jgi:hypothetical protein
MSTKPDWRTVNEQLMTQKHEHDGEPPTTEEILAYSRGELSPDEEERMRERLVSHPEILRALAVPFPSEGAGPGEPDYLTDEEWPEHWAVLQKRMHRGRVVDFRRHAWTALAAVLALVFAGLYWQAERKAGRPRSVGEEVELRSELRRGPGGPPQTVVVEDDTVVLSASVTDRDDDAFRMAIFDADGTRELWRSERLHPRSDQSVAIVVPRSFLSPGDYRISLYGVQGSREESLATYTVHIPAP